MPSKYIDPNLLTCGQRLGCVHDWSALVNSRPPPVRQSWYVQESECSEVKVCCASMEGKLSEQLQILKKETITGEAGNDPEGGAWGESNGENGFFSGSPRWPPWCPLPPW